MRTLFLLLLMALSGCPGGPVQVSADNGPKFPWGAKWMVLKQPGYNPFIHRNNAQDAGFYIKPLSFDPMDVEGHSLAAYKAGMAFETRASFEEDLSKATMLFLERVHQEGSSLRILDAPAPGAFIVETSATSWDPGEFGLFIAKDSQLIAVVSILDPQGHRIENIGFRSGGGSGVIAGNRIRNAAERLGESVAEYLHERVFP